MRALIAGLFFSLGIIQAQAVDRWQFTERLSLGANPSNPVYHHLDGAGRKHLAVSGEFIAATWEDNRDGSPQIYAALKSLQRPGFSPALKVSAGSEAYEPAIEALGDGRFLIGYEQDATAFVRVLSVDGIGDAIKLGESAGHVSVAAHGSRAFASWREIRERRWFVVVASLRVSADDMPDVESRQLVEAEGLDTPVLFPVIAANADGLCIAWEDRRAGHTRLLISYSTDAGSHFAEPQSLNEFFSNRNQYDQGNGVTRVTLASFGEDEILAAWMDKRRGGSGYGIFAALGSGAGDVFGPNEKVHGAEGDQQPHYNPSAAGNRKGEFVVAWDDFRRGDSDVWISVYNDDLEWSEDYAPMIASGSGEQSHPSVALDARGGLHLLWIDRESLDGPSRLWYSHGILRSQ